MKKGNGFTLIELLVVVLIIGILAGIAVPQYERAVERSRAAEALIILKTIADTNKAYFMANGVYAQHLDELDVEIPGEDIVFNGWRRKQTDKFQFGTQAKGYPNSIALANRLPFGTVYYLYVMPDVNGTFCHPYIEKGEEICKTLSGGNKKDGEYLIN